MERNVVDVDVLANEVFVLARCLFGLAPELGEMLVANNRAFAADPERVERLTGKYVRHHGFQGYVYVRGNGLGGNYVSELPSGVGSDAVVDDELNLSATPLQDRLAEIRRGLRDCPDRRATALADAVGRILKACDPGHSRQVLGVVVQSAMDTVPAFQNLAPAMALMVGQRFLEDLGQMAASMRARPTADARMTASLFIMRDLPKALAGAAGPQPVAQAVELAANIGFLSAPSGAPLDALASGLCRRAIKQGYRDVVYHAAEALKVHGDELITKALDGGLSGFYPPLFEAASYEMAAQMVASAVAETAENSAARRRWAKLAVNAEERFVRIGVSLSVAVENIDGTYLGQKRAFIRAVREREGDDAAIAEARDCIENKLLYPREAMPILLGTEDDALRARALRPDPR